MASMAAVSGHGRRGHELLHRSLDPRRFAARIMWPPSERILTYPASYASRTASERPYGMRYKKLSRLDRLAAGILSSARLQGRYSPRVTHRRRSVLHRVQIAAMPAGQLRAPGEPPEVSRRPVATCVPERVPTAAAVSVSTKTADEMAALRTRAFGKVRCSRPPWMQVVSGTYPQPKKSRDATACHVLATRCPPKALVG